MTISLCNIIWSVSQVLRKGTCYKGVKSSKINVHLKTAIAITSSRNVERAACMLKARQVSISVLHFLNFSPAVYAQSQRMIRNNKRIAELAIITSRIIAVGFYFARGYFDHRVLFRRTSVEHWDLIISVSNLIRRARE